MDQYISQFLSTLSTHKGYTENTIAAYRNDLSQFAQFIREERGGVAEPSEVTPELVEAYVASLQRAEGGYAPSTVARKIAAVKSYFHFLSEQQIISANPALRLNSPKIKKSAPKTLSREEIERLLAAPRQANNPKALRDSALLELLCATGMRVTEVVNLGAGDLDWEQGDVICRSKDERERRIPMASAQAPLREYVDHARAELQHDGSPETLFLNHRGKKLTRQGVWLILREAAEAAGIQAEVTPRTLRHSFAKHLIGSGENLRRVQKLLGHANLSTTQVYRQPGAPGAAPGEAKD
ncbi:MAG: tyrosine-type recombinase/integrase [Anaerolineales bacterium]|nr:tyrosine-type recombinase/integrase [Anaerolineales bacterium]